MGSTPTWGTVEVNIKKIGSRTAELTLAENPTVDDRQSVTGLRSGGSLKQEVKYEKS